MTKIMSSDKNARPHKFSRRDIGRMIALTVTGTSILPSFAVGTVKQGKWKNLEASFEAVLTRQFGSVDSEIKGFARQIISRCIIQRIQDPMPQLNHTWIAPGGGYFAQWLWDTVFVTDLLALVPETQTIIRDIYQNFWDFQARWDASHPDFAKGMIANHIAPDGLHSGRDGRNWLKHPVFSQAPLLAWGVERCYRRSGDVELVKRAINPLEEFHEWYWRERDVKESGLIAVGAYSGITQDARYETYDNEVDLDKLILTAHPARRGVGKWYGDICIPANTAYLLVAEESLAHLAEIAGDKKMSERRMRRYKKGSRAMQKYMWSGKDGCFLALQRDSLTQIGPPTVGGFVPLMAGIPSKRQAKRMKEALMSPAWKTPLAIPTVIATAEEYKSSSFWRGDVWPAPVFQVCTGLSRYGEAETARSLAGNIIENAIRQGVSEHYDSSTGKPLGVPFLGMSAVLFTMIVDGFYHSRNS